MQRKSKHHLHMDAKWDGLGCHGQTTVTSVAPSLNTITQTPTQYNEPSARYCSSRLESLFSVWGFPHGIH